MSRIHHILVTGATGKQGGAVARHLHQAGFSVYALTRRPDTLPARRLQEQGITLRVGNLDDRGSLDRALAGIEGVFSVQNYWEPGVGMAGEIRQGMTLADAARAAQIQHYVQSTMADAPTVAGVEHFVSKQAIEQYLATTGLPTTRIGTVYFMDNLLDPQMGGRMTFPVLAGSLRPETPFQMIAVDDIGAIAAAVFQDRARWIGTKINVAGDVLTVGAMKAVYRQVTGRRPPPWRIPAWVLRRFNRDFAAQLRWHTSVGWRFDHTEAATIHPGLMTFAQFLQRYLPYGFR